MRGSTQVREDQTDINKLWSYVYGLKKEIRELKEHNDKQDIMIVQLQSFIAEIAVPIDRISRDFKLYLNKEEVRD